MAGESTRQATVFGAIARAGHEVSPEVLREHWSGSTDILQSIQNVLNAADNLVGSDILAKLKRSVK